MKALTQDQREVREQLALRSKGRCEARIVGVCQGKADHPHHRKLKGQGGEDTLTNLLDCCWACHGHIHLNVAWSRSHGLLVHHWEDPAQVHVNAGATLPSHVT